MTYPLNSPPPLLCWRFAIEKCHSWPMTRFVSLYCAWLGCAASKCKQQKRTIEHNILFDFCAFVACILMQYIVSWVDLNECFFGRFFGKKTFIRINQAYDVLHQNASNKSAKIEHILFDFCVFVACILMQYIVGLVHLNEFFFDRFWPQKVFILVFLNTTTKKEVFSLLSLLFTFWSCLLPQLLCVLLPRLWIWLKPLLKPWLQPLFWLAWAWAAALLFSLGFCLYWQTFFFFTFYCVKKHSRLLCFLLCLVFLNTK